MENFTPFSSLAGGILIGLSASILMALNGRIAGISGILGNILSRSSVVEKAWRLSFVGGLIAGAFVYNDFFPISIAPREHISTLLLLIGGLAIGFGTSLGNGCTSGHGICGISRFSVRSMLATTTFLLSVDKQLLIGAAIFGAGWGLIGYCPGPAVASLSIDIANAGIVLGAMLAGILLQQLTKQ